jgi:hypothetical protein
VARTRTFALSKLDVFWCGVCCSFPRRSAKPNPEVLTLIPFHVFAVCRRPDARLGHTILYPTQSGAYAITHNDTLGPALNSWARSTELPFGSTLVHPCRVAQIFSVGLVPVYRPLRCTSRRWQMRQLDFRSRSAATYKAGGAMQLRSLALPLTYPSI